jgi:ADP-heptose:LPS heptosyltransferase
VPQMRAVFPPGTIFFDRLTIPQLVSAQARLTLFISNDTGPAHIAAAAGTPVVVVMDRPNPHSYTPVGNQSRLVFGRIISEIAVTDVYQAARELLASNRTDQLIHSRSS